MGKPSEIEVQEILHPYYADISGAIENAWSDWLGSTEFSRTRFPRTRANIVWDRITAHARHRLAQHSRIHTIERNESVAFFFHDKVLLRFKKADSSGMSRNAPTQQVLRFLNPQQTLFGEQARVEAVYVLNVLQTRISDIQIVARNGSAIDWAFSILPSADVSSIKPERMVDLSVADDLVMVKVPELDGSVSKP